MEPQLLSYLERIAVALEGIRFNMGGLRVSCESFLEEISDEVGAASPEPLHFPPK